MPSTAFTRLVVIPIILLLSACTTGSNPVVSTIQHAFKPGMDLTNISLDPNVRFLRVVVDGRVTLLALGYIERDSGGPIEVWYSIDREVLRLQNGHVVGAVGFTTEWRKVTQSGQPSWRALSQATQPVRWTRQRDVMPGYHFGITDVLSSHRIAPPANSELYGLDPVSLTWFEEQTAPASQPDHSNTTDTSLPVARYAVDTHDGKELVVYGEVCLTHKLCFSWQHWPVAPGKQASIAKGQMEK